MTGRLLGFSLLMTDGGGEKEKEREKKREMPRAAGVFGFSVIDGPKQGREWERRLMKERKNGG